MKKSTWLCGLLALCLLAGGCGKADGKPAPAPLEPSAAQPAMAGDVTLELDAASYPLDTEQLTVAITNHTGEEISYGTYYSIEILQDEQWRTIPFVKDFGFHDIAILLAPGKTQQESIDLTACDFVFTEGHYRLVKELGGRDCSVEFELVKDQ